MVTWSRAQAILVAIFLDPSGIARTDELNGPQLYTVAQPLHTDYDTQILLTTP